MSIAATRVGTCPHALQLWTDNTPKGHPERRRWHPYTVACRLDAGHDGPHRNRKIGGERW